MSLPDHWNDVDWKQLFKNDTVVILFVIYGIYDMAVIPARVNMSYFLNHFQIHHYEGIQYAVTYGDMSCNQPELNNMIQPISESDLKIDLSGFDHHISTDQTIYEILVFPPAYKLPG